MLVALAVTSVIGSAIGVAATRFDAARGSRMPAHVSGAVGATSHPVASRPRPVEGKPLPPAQGLYVGAAPDAHPSESAATEAEMLDNQIGRPLSITSVYIDFDQPVRRSVLEAIADTGSAPMVSVQCQQNDAAIAAGDDDGIIRADAETLRAFGGPVFLRWFWEMNLTTLNATCLGPLTTAATDFVAAWRRIWRIFQEVGATNVAFVWAPSAAPGASSAAPFFPGTSYVDWIGSDIYDRGGYGPFATMYAPFYEAWSSKGLPLMLSETGAVGSSRQASWLSEISKAVDRSFHDLKAVVYNDGKTMVIGRQGKGSRAFSELVRRAAFVGAFP